MRQARPVARAVGMLPALSVLMVACGPVLDWRQFQPDGWPLVLSMPCKPGDQQRSIPLAGTTAAWRLLSCSADDHVFAVASADVGDPARVGPALQALAAAAQANVRATIVDDQPAAVPGMTPQAAARRWRLRGQLPDARPVREQVQVFAHGTRVFQASVIGPVADDARAGPFFDALRVQP
jgi:hypothetical protein